MIGNLPPAREYASARATATEQMLADVVAGSNAPAGHRRKAVTWVAGAAVVGVAVAGAAVAREAFAPAPDRSLARCHTTADPGRGDNFAGSSVAAADANGVVAIDRAIESCADLWRQGMFTLGSDHRVGEPNPAGSAAVPPLVGCVDPDGVAAVFPGGKNLCTSLGLAVLVEVP